MKNLHNTKYQQYLIEFTSHMNSTKSMKSGDHHTGRIKDFLLFLEQKQIHKLAQVKKVTMLEYIEILEVRPKQRGTGTLSKVTLNNYLYTLRTFSKRMQMGKHIERAIPVPNNFKIEYSSTNDFSLTRQIVTVDEIKEVFDACDTPLEKVVIALAYGNAVRRIGLVNLLENNVDFVAKTLFVEKTKNNKQRTIPISKFFLEVLKEYSTYRLRTLANNNTNTTTYLINDNGKPCSGNSLNERLKKVIMRTKNWTIINKKITLHCLRHSTACHMLDSGCSYDYVKNYLGHSASDTTAIYARRRKIKNYFTI